MELSELNLDKIEIKNYLEIYDRSFNLPGSFGLRLSPNGKKAFFYIYKIANKRKRVTLGYFPLLSLDSAKEEAQRIAKLVYTEGKDPKADFLNKAKTFNELFEWFIQNDLKKKTKLEYKRLYEKEIKKFIANYKPNIISTEDISKILKQISKDKNRLTTANRVRSLISRVFNFGIENGIVDNNPAKAINALLVPERVSNLLDLEQIKIIWHSLKRYNPSTEGLFKTIILTAQSPTKLHKLEWSEINFDSLCYSLPIALPPASIQIIKSLRFPNGKDQYVFGNYSKKHYSTLQRNFKKILLESKLNDSFSLFELRKSIEAQLRIIGVNQFVIAYIMQKKTEIDKLKGLKQVNLENEAKVCLERWARIITSSDKNDGNKVVPLFR